MKDKEGKRGRSQLPAHGCLLAGRCLQPHRHSAPSHIWQTSFPRHFKPHPAPYSLQLHHQHSSRRATASRSMRKGPREDSGYRHSPCSTLQLGDTEVPQTLNCGSPVTTLNSYNTPDRNKAAIYLKSTPEDSTVLLHPLQDLRISSSVFKM